MQLHKHISNSLPNRYKKNNFKNISVTILAVGALLYGCGENRVAQCNKVVKVANKTKTLVAPKDVSGFVPLADNIDQIRTEMQAIALQDSKLNELQGQLLAMYGDVSQALRSQAKASDGKDKNAIEKAKQDLVAAVGKESDIVDRLNALCSK